MLGNIVDHCSPHVDAMFEPSIYDDRRRSGEPFGDGDKPRHSGAHFAVA